MLETCHQVPKVGLLELSAPFSSGLSPYNFWVNGVGKNQMRPRGARNISDVSLGGGAKLLDCS